MIDYYKTSPLVHDSDNIKDIQIDVNMQEIHGRELIFICKYTALCWKNLKWSNFCMLVIYFPLAAQSINTKCFLIGKPLILP